MIKVEFDKSTVGVILLGVFLLELVCVGYVIAGGNQISILRSGEMADLYAGDGSGMTWYFCAECDTKTCSDVRCYYDEHGSGMYKWQDGTDSTYYYAKASDQPAAIMSNDLACWTLWYNCPDNQYNQGLPAECTGCQAYTIAYRPGDCYDDECGLY